MLYQLFVQGKFAWSIIASRIAEALVDTFGGPYKEIYKLIVNRSELVYTIKSAISDGKWSWDEVVDVAIAIADVVLGVIPGANWWKIATFVWDVLSFA